MTFLILSALKNNRDSPPSTTTWIGLQDIGKREQFSKI